MHQQAFACARELRAVCVPDKPCFQILKIDSVLACIRQRNLRQFGARTMR